MAIDLQREHAVHARRLAERRDEEPAVDQPPEAG
jgi:hypothetical protein